MQNINKNELWNKIQRSALKIGKDTIRKILELYFVMLKPDVPVKIKITIISALIYFVIPLDIIPDFIPGGYTDDIGAVLGAFTIAHSYIDDNVRNKADITIQQWFNKNIKEG